MEGILGVLMMIVTILLSIVAGAFGIWLIFILPIQVFCKGKKLSEKSMKSMDKLTEQKIRKAELENKLKELEIEKMQKEVRNEN